MRSCTNFNLIGTLQIIFLHFHGFYNKLQNNYFIIENNFLKYFTHCNNTNKITEKLTINRGASEVRNNNFYKRIVSLRK